MLGGELVNVLDKQVLGKFGFCVVESDFSYLKITI